MKFFIVLVRIERTSSFKINYEHESRRKYKCKYCDYIAHTSSNLRNHIRVHSGERPYTCPVCKKDFTQKGNMLRHYTRHFTENDDNCPICSEKYLDKTQVILHMNMHMPYENKTKSMAVTLVM